MYIPWIPKKKMINPEKSQIEAIKEVYPSGGADINKYRKTRYEMYPTADSDVTAPV
jgi:hypothetical protein